jgi:IPT/TIG domain
MPSQPTDKKGPPAWGGWVAIAGLGAIVAIFVVAALKYKASDVATAISPAAGVIAAIVGAYFGIRGATLAQSTQLEAQRAMLAAGPPPKAQPRVTGVKPSSGSASGGDSVAISGAGFTDATAVNFGSSPATNLRISDTQISCTSPPGSGIVDITVTTPQGTSEASDPGQFTYV